MTRLFSLIGRAAALLTCSVVLAVMVLALVVTLGLIGVAVDALF